MGRIRTIKPEFWKNDRLSLLPESTHMLAGALINYADDEGYFNANPALIKAECFPLREPSVSIPVSLTKLSGINYIERGVHEGRFYGRIVNFSEHQRVNHPTSSKIKILPIKWGEFTEDSVSPPEKFLNPPDSLRPEGKGREGNRRGLKGETSLSSNGARPCIPYEEILEDLNSISGKHFSFKSKATQRLIQARFDEGRTVEDFKKVHRNKSDWKDDPKWNKFLRPETLYAASHFESYLNEQDKSDPDEWRY